MNSGLTTQEGIIHLSKLIKMSQIAKQTQLELTIQSTGIESGIGNFIKNKFLPFFEQAESWKTKAESLVVTDVSQVREMKMAREARLALKEIRVNADKTRKELKEESLRYGKAVQGVYNVIEYLIAPIEKHLEDQEKYAEIQEAKRKAELNILRKNEIQPFVEFIPYELNLGELSEEVYLKTLNNAKILFQAKIEAEKKAEAERIAKEKAEAEERERIRLENAKLKAEAEEREKQIAKERAKAEAERKAIEEKARKERELSDAKLKAEREENERIQKELNAKKAQEEKIKRQQEEEESRKKQELINAQKAPDKEKLAQLAKQFETIVIPELKTAKAKELSKNIQELQLKLVQYILNNVKNI